MLAETVQQWYAEAEQQGMQRYSYRFALKGVAHLVIH